MAESTMYRRSFLVGSVLAFAGCTTQPGQSSPSDAGTPTQAHGLGTIEYTVTNEDDTTHRLEVAMENAEGRVVQETVEPAFEPGAVVESGSAGDPPDLGPYTLTFRTETTDAAYVWDVTECGRVHLRVTITDDGSIEIERDLCQN